MQPHLHSMSVLNVSHISVLFQGAVIASCFV